MLAHDEFGPEKILSVYDPRVGMRGVLVIDNTALGPAKGGIRMTSTVGVREVMQLARTMTWKCALAGLPFGGGKAGIRADSKAMGPAKKKALVESFAKALRPLCPSLYIAAPDMYMGEREMAWFAGANGHRAACTGKPEDLGGLPHELGSTGYGVFHAARAAAPFLGLDLSRATFAVEGFGNVGRFAARFLVEAGATLVSVSDSTGTVSSREGLDFAVLCSVKDEMRAVTAYASTGRPVCQVGPCENVFTAEADILITAARPHVIQAGDVRHLRCRLLVEGSNIPLTLDAEELCHETGITVVPDFVANAGGVISSYVEWKGGGKDEVFPLVEERVAGNTTRVLQAALDRGITPRQAALSLAKERVRATRPLAET